MYILHNFLEYCYINNMYLINYLRFCQNPNIVYHQKNLFIRFHLKFK